jgi:uncharacterized repeat protein (TIGR01451 family)
MFTHLNRHFIFFLCFAAVLLAMGWHYQRTTYSSPLTGTIIYVNHAAAGNNDGSSWEDAFTDLQDGLAAAAAGDEIWVATGLYKPTTTTDRAISFELKSDVAIYGGFVATETHRLERDWETNITVLSGDIDDNDITDPHGVVTDTANIVGDNSYHVVFASNIGDTAVLDGFTITAGSADGSNPHIRGGGVYNQSGDATLANLLFIGNQAMSGGGMYIHSGSPSLTNIIFNNNRATDNDWGRGGGLSIWAGSSTLTHVQFINNQANRSGGGLFIISSGPSPTLIDVVFRGNQAIRGSGGGMYNDNGQYALVDVHFINNSANWGGGLYAGGHHTDGSSIMTNVTFIGNHATIGGGGMANWWPDHVLTNVIFSGNSAGSFGGAIYNSSSIILTNVTFSGNKADVGGGAIYNEGQQIDPTPWAMPPIDAGSETETKRPNTAGPGYQSTPTPTPPGKMVGTTGNNSPNQQRETAVQTSSPDPTMTPVANANPAYPEPGRAYSAGINTTSPILQNVVFWNNEDSSGVGTAASSLVNVNGANPIIRHSLVQGCNPDGVWVAACGTNDGGNLADSDPLFIESPDPADAPTDEGNLRLQSGSPAIDAGNNEYVEGIETDLDGNARISGLFVDLGPYEHQEVVTYTIAVHVVGEGSVELEPDQSGYLYGEVVTVTAVATPGWHFAGWEGDLYGDDNPAELVMDSNKEITATFANDPPTAVAGPPQTAETNQPVMLDGSGSSDSDPTQTLTYGWLQTGGPNVTLSDSTAVTPTFIAPASRTVLTFTLTVTNSWGMSSSPDEVVITVQEPGLAAGLHASPSLAGVGHPITFTLTITNNGDLVLSGLSVTTTLPMIFDLPLTLDPGLSASYQATYTVQADDWPGPLVNEVWVTAVSPAGIPLLTETTAVVPLSPLPTQHTLYLPLLYRLSN